MFGEDGETGPGSYGVNSRGLLVDCGVGTSTVHVGCGEGLGGRVGAPAQIQVPMNVGFDPHRSGRGSDGAKESAHDLKDNGISPGCDFCPSQGRRVQEVW